MAASTPTRREARIACVALALTLIAASPASAASGDFDSSFAGGGAFVTTFGEQSQGRAIARQPDGKLVVAAAAGYGSTPLLPVPTVARFGPNGSPDLSFSGDGVALAAASGEATAGAPVGVALQPDGKIVVLDIDALQTAVVRLTATGEMDPTFSGDGVAPVPSAQLFEAAIALQADGRIVIVGSTVGSPSTETFASRLNPDGTPDLTFGTAGTTVLESGAPFDKPGEVLVDVQGRILIGGIAGDGYYTMRLLPSGAADQSYSGDGVSLVAGVNFSATEFSGAALDSAGRTVVASNASDGAMGLVRFGPDGAPDPTFGEQGIARKRFSDGVDEARSVAIRPTGEIVVAGASKGDAAVAQFTSAGQPDTSFGTAGLRTRDLGGPLEEANDILLDEAGRATVVGTGGDPRRAFLGRLLFVPGSVPPAADSSLPPAAASNPLAPSPTAGLPAPASTKTPIGADRTPPRVTVDAPSSVRVASRVTVRLRCPAERCKATVSSKVRLPKVGRGKARTLRLPTSSRTIAEGRTTDVRIALPAKVRGAVRKALDAGKPVRLVVRVVVRDAAGNRTVRSSTIRLRRG